MKWQYNLAKEDYENAVIAYIDRHAGKMKLLSPVLIGASVVLILLALFLFVNRTGSSINAWIVALWAVLFFVLGIFTNSKFKARRFVQARIKSGAIPQGYFGSQSVELKDERILVSYGMVSDRSYSAIIKEEDYPDAIILFGTGAALDIIPIKAFKNSEERDNFINVLNEKIAIARNKAINNEHVAKSRAEARLILDYTYDEAELIAALATGNQVFVKTPLFMTGARIFILLLGLGLIGLSIYMMVQGFVHIAISLFILYLGAIMLLPLRLMFAPFIRRAVARNLRNGGFPNDSIGPQVVCFMEDRLKSFTLSASYELSYAQLYAAKLTDEYLVLLGQARTVHVFPIVAFDSVAAAGDILKFISDKTEIKLL